MTAGNEEHEPLINSSAEHQRVSYNATDNYGQNGVSATYRARSYATNDGSVSLLLPQSEAASGVRLAYAWRELDVFVGPSGARGLRRLWTRRTPDSAPARKHILRSVSGAAYPGELLAILGSSGAGKTTLLNALTFRAARGARVTGARALAGRPATRAALAAAAAYVQQDDLFIGTLTVREHLIFQALVRMDRDIPYARRMLRVDEVISEDIGGSLVGARRWWRGGGHTHEALVACQVVDTSSGLKYVSRRLPTAGAACTFLALSKCQNTVIGVPGRLKGISGGEMKRLAFAAEVLTDPPLMFCDEPTSGLDSFMAQNVIQVLKGLAQKGKTVVCTIHQPSSELFAMFDKLLLMAEGRVAFLGSPQQAGDFFRELGAACPANYNPADHYIQLLAVVPSKEEVSKQTIETICDTFQKSEIGCELAADIERDTEQLGKSGGWGDEVARTPYRASWCAQFRAVMWRSWLSVIKEPMLIKVRFLQTIMVAILIGVIYFGQELDQDGVMNINGAIFMFLTNMTFQNVFAVISVFCSELPVFLREHRAGMYRVDVYFLCKTLAEAPVFASIPLVFTSIAYYMVGLNPAPARFFIASAVAALVANVATSFGYLISCASNSVSMAMSIGPPVVIPFMLFGGFFLNSGSVPVYLEWISYLSWFRYGNEALLVNQWAGVNSIACTRANSSCPASGAVVLHALAFDEDDFTMDIVNMVLLIIGFRFVAYLALFARSKRTE